MKKFCVVLSILISVLSGIAQNASYNANTVPISGTNNAAFGYQSLLNATTGYNNAAVGYQASLSNTIGFHNCAFGADALKANIKGYRNVALGYNALTNCGREDNTAIGARSMESTDSGFRNVAVGSHSLLSNTSGAYNVAVGMQALETNTTGVGNTAIGESTLGVNVSGFNNTAVGAHAFQANITGDNNTLIGAYADARSTSLTNATALGYNAIVNASDKIRFGDVNVTVVEGPVAYTVSDGRFKNNISETDVKGLEFINRLRPVVYNFDTKKFEEFLTQNMSQENRSKYIGNKDFSKSTNIRQSGFIAQEVEKAAADVSYTFNGIHAPESKNDNYSIAYSQFVVPLVKAVQELSAQNELLKKEMDELKQLIKNNGSGNTEGSIKINESNEVAKLFQNTPNPFNQSTVIRYSIPATAKKAFITITSLNGSKIKEFNLKNNDNQAVEISGGQLSAGSYIYTLIVDDRLIDSKQMILTR